MNELSINNMKNVIVNYFGAESYEMGYFMGALSVSDEAARQAYNSIFEEYVTSDYEDDADLEMGFDPYEGDYTFDC